MGGGIVAEPSVEEVGRALAGGLGLAPPGDSAAGAAAR